MEDGAGEQEVGEGSLRGNGQEVSFVLRVDLDAKTNCKTHTGLVQLFFQHTKCRKSSAKDHFNSQHLQILVYFS